MWGEPPKCRQCGKLIAFVPTRKGRLMPVDSFSLTVLPDDKGTLFYTERGEQVRGRPVAPTIKGAVRVYEPHWYTCSNAAANRKPRPNPARDAIRERIEQARADEARREAAREEKAAAERVRIEAEKAQYSLFGGMA